MADSESTIIENVRDSLKPGLDVYDRDRKKVGSVWQIHRVSGYITVLALPLPKYQDNPLSEKYLYIPFRLITNIDARELFLSATRDEIRRDFANPPSRSTRIEAELGAEIAVTTEPSGYDGTPVEVRRASIDDLKKDIAVGDRVLSFDLTDLGTVKDYDPAAGWVSVTRDAMSDEPTLWVPVAIVDVVDPDQHTVHLISSEADLERMEHLLPATEAPVRAGVRAHS